MPPNWLIWLRRIGYVTTAIVVIELASLSVIVGWDMYCRHRAALARQDETAQQRGGYMQRDYLKAEFATLPPLSSLMPDGLRFIAYPSLDQTTYAVAFRLLPGDPVAKGVLVINHYPSDGANTSRRYACRLDTERYSALVHRIDARMDGYGGSRATFGTDGTDIALERIRGRTVTSGGGNFEEPYRGIGKLMLGATSLACPEAALPLGGHDWYRPDR